MIFEAPGEGPAGLVRPPFRLRRQPRQHGARRRARRWRPCGSGCGPTRPVRAGDPRSRRPNIDHHPYRGLSVQEVDVPLTEEAITRATCSGARSTAAPTSSRCATAATPRWSRCARRDLEPLFSPVIAVAGASPGRTTPRGSTARRSTSATPPRWPARPCPARPTTVVLRPLRARQLHRTARRRSRSASPRWCRPSRRSCSTRPRRPSPFDEDLPPRRADPRRRATSRTSPAAPRGALPAAVPGSGADLGGADVSYLDTRPAERARLAARSAASARCQFHRHFYGDDAAAGRPVPAATRPAAGRARAHQVLPASNAGSRSDGPTPRSVPWGANLDEVREGLRTGSLSSTSPAAATCRPPRRLRRSTATSGRRPSSHDAVRRPRPHSSLARHPRRARAGPGRRRAGPRRGRRAHRGARATSSGSTSRGRRGHPRLRALHARADPPRSRRCSRSAPREWVYYGATVQDLSDTWFGAGHARRRRRRRPRPRPRAATRPWRSPRRHRDTVMCGRTHGQPGLPITFGFKAAVWAAELRRHLERLARGPAAVGGRPARRGARHDGVLGPSATCRCCDGFARAARASARRTSRGSPRATASPSSRPPGAGRRRRWRKIGNEIYELQRPEIGELGEPIIARARSAASRCRTSATPSSPSTSTRSPAWCAPTPASRSRASCALHERDGRGWKAEWLVLPEACQLTGAALRVRRAAAGGARGRRRRGCAPTSRRHGAGDDLRAADGACSPRGSASTPRTTPCTPRRWPPATRATTWASSSSPTGLLDEEEVAAAPDPAQALGCGRGVRGPGRGPGRGPASVSLARPAAAPARRRCPRRCSPRPGCRTPSAWRSGSSATTSPGSGSGGNKVRGLEFLLADALERGCDHPGHRRRPGLELGDARRARGPHARARRDARLLRRPRARRSATCRSRRRSSADIRSPATPTARRSTAGSTAVADELRAAGHTPVSRWAAAARPRSARSATSPRPASWRASSPTRACVPAAIWLATGSCGTQAGLVAGAAWQGLGPVVGVTVSRPAEECVARVTTLARAVADLARRARPGRRRRPWSTATSDPATGSARPRASAAARAGRPHRGRVPRPVFGAKAMAGLLAAAAAAARWRGPSSSWSPAAPRPCSRQLPDRPARTNRTPRRDTIPLVTASRGSRDRQPVTHTTLIGARCASATGRS